MQTLPIPWSLASPRGSSEELVTTAFNSLDTITLHLIYYSNNHRRTGNRVFNVSCKSLELCCSHVRSIFAVKVLGSRQKGKMQ